MSSPPPPAPSFPFPYEPYGIQTDFMEALFSCIDKGQVGIFESPTGTGKTQSVVNGSMTWLRGQSGVFDDSLDIPPPPPPADAAPTSLPSWVMEDTRKRKREEVTALRAAVERKRIRKAGRALQREASSRRASVGMIPPPQGGDAEFLLDDPEGEPRGGLAVGAYSDSSSDSSCGADLSGVQGRPQIIFCSRTHTQLEQFVSEMKKTVWWKDVPSTNGEGSFAVRPIQMTSRMHVCLNNEILEKSKQRSDRLNDLCKDSSCVYKTPANVSKMVDRMRVRSIDIEELIQEGKHKDNMACPYYVARKAASLTELDGYPATVLAVPYAAILTSAARASFGINLKGNVLILDEAHNLLSAVNDAHSVTLRLSVLAFTVKSLQAYTARYCNRLHVKNKVKLRQLLAVLKQILAFLGNTEYLNGTERLINATDFSFATGIEGVNAPDLTKFIRESKLFNKLQGFTESSPEPADTKRPSDPSTKRPSIAQMYSVENFLYQGLVGDLKYCRLLLKPGADPSLSLVSIFAGAFFEEIVKDARSVVLAGGTMSPVSDFLAELLPHLPKERLTTFSCGHVIPLANIRCTVVRGHTSNTLMNPLGELHDYDFRHTSRNNTAMLTSLLQDLVAICTTTSGGVIIFFPSYAYERLVWDTWHSAGLLHHLTTLRCISREPRSGEGSVADVLQSYQKACDEGIRGGRGGLLSSVVGGKLSEGINFADHYGRAVVVVGMPYPNTQDPLLKEKQRLVAETSGAGAASRMLDVMCMKAVNQSIGRAFRHKNDYAAIFLFDQRYAREDTKALLPHWISRAYCTTPTLSPALPSLNTFFTEKQEPKEG